MDRGESEKLYRLPRDTWGGRNSVPRDLVLNGDCKQKYDLATYVVEKLNPFETYFHILRNIFSRRNERNKESHIRINIRYTKNTIILAKIKRI